jgi:hypothetical protein
VTDTPTPDLREQIAAAILAADQSVDHPISRYVQADAALSVVAPLLAERDRLRVRFEVRSAARDRYRSERDAARAEVARLTEIVGQPAAVTFPKVDAMPDPDGCALCGIEKRSHYTRYWPSPGPHRWTPPTDAQRLERMQARRVARGAATGGIDEEDACPHCSPTHERPESRPWGVYVAPDRADGQPTHLVAAPSNGAHVAQSDADWLNQLISDYQPAVSPVDAPMVWQLLPVPEPPIGTTVRDRDGDIWTRRPGGDWGFVASRTPWRDVLDYAPLTEVLPDTGEVSP